MVLRQNHVMRKIRVYRAEFNVSEAKFLVINQKQFSHFLERSKSRMKNHTLNTSHMMIIHWFPVILSSRQCLGFCCRFLKSQPSALSKMCVMVQGLPKKQVHEAVHIKKQALQRYQQVVFFVKE